MLYMAILKKDVGRREDYGSGIVLVYSAPFLGLDRGNLQSAMFEWK